MFHLGCLDPEPPAKTVSTAQRRWKWEVKEFIGANLEEGSSHPGIEGGGTPYCKVWSLLHLSASPFLWPAASRRILQVAYLELRVYFPLELHC